MVCSSDQLIDKSLARLFKKKRHELLIPPIKRKHQYISADFILIKRIIRKYSKQLYVQNQQSNEVNNLNEIDKMLEKHKLAKFTQEKINTLVSLYP